MFTKALTLLGALLLYLAGPALALAEEKPEPLVYQVKYKSPDGRFALRLGLPAGFGDAGETELSNVQTVELVSRATGRPVANLLPEEEVGSSLEGLKVLWSKDSQWCAFCYQSVRVSYLKVLQHSGRKFQLRATENDLRVDGERWVKGAKSTRNEYLWLRRWTAPGCLLLEQYSIFRSDSGEPLDISLQLAAQYSAKQQRFHLTQVRESKRSKADTRE